MSRDYHLKKQQQKFEKLDNKLIYPTKTAPLIAALSDIMLLTKETLPGVVK
jgi:hypothetical protein